MLLFTALRPIFKQAKLVCNTVFQNTPTFVANIYLFFVVQHISMVMPYKTLFFKIQIFTLIFQLFLCDQIGILGRYSNYSGQTVATARSHWSQVDKYAILLVLFHFKVQIKSCYIMYLPNNRL